MKPASKDTLAVLLNGKAKSVNDGIVKLLASRLHPDDLFVSNSLKDSRRIVRKIVQRRYRTVLTGGGDGTLATFITHLEEHLDAESIDDYLPRLGVLKLGTGNAFASTFGAGHADPLTVDRDLDYAANGAITRPLRLLEVEGKVTPFSGLGLDALILNSYRIVRAYTEQTPANLATQGLAGYALGIAGISIPQYVSEKAPDCVIVNEGAPVWRVGLDGERIGPMILKGEVIHRGPARIVAASKLPFYGFDFKLFPYAMTRDDRFHLRVCDMAVHEVLANLPAIWKGRFKDRNLHDFLADKVSVHLSSPAPFQIGGDGEGYRSFVTYSLRPRLYEVIDFRHLRGASKRLASLPLARIPLTRPLANLASAFRSAAI